MSSPEPVEVDGKQVPTISDQGLDVEVAQLARRRRPARHRATAERDAAIAAIQKMHDSPEWKEILEKEDLTDFFRTGDEFKAFIDSENERVRDVLKDIGLTQ